MKKPIIGITLDIEEPGGYSKFHWYAIRKNYIDSVEKLGGITLPLSHNISIVENYINIIDGLIITGGNFDISPSIYGETPMKVYNEKIERTKFEIEICKKSLEKNIPVMGICGGEQVLNVCLGGTLIEDIKSRFPNALNHEQKQPRNKTSHAVLIEASSKLYKIINQEKIYVNSAHHQSVDKPGKNIKICGKAEDGIIEAIECEKYKWCLGLQWHPEFLITNSDRLIFENFIKNTN